MQTVVVLTGAGVSAESGLRTFRDSDGLWEGHRVEDVATPEAWHRDPETVLRFYDERRRSVLAAKPNAAHRALASLEAAYNVQIITQNIDDLHERAGSTNVLHLHGEIIKARSTVDEQYVIPIKHDIDRSARCPHGGCLRPHIVWFGEAVPMIEEAARITHTADILIVIGTSLVVYPAAGLVRAARSGIPKFLVDPKADDLPMADCTYYAQSAGVGVPALVETLLADH